MLATVLRTGAASSAASSVAASAASAASAARAARAGTSSVRRVSVAAVAAARRPLSSSVRAANAASSPAPSRPCPSCGAPIPLPASPCPSCGSLVPIPAALSLHSLLSVSNPVPKGTDAETFNIPAELSGLPAHGYALDARDLRNRMLKRQAVLHPDRHNGHDLAAELSARVNKAYETLADPLRRAQYILQQYGMDIQEREEMTDHELLMEILEAREELDEANTPEDIQALRDANHAKVEAVERKINAAFSIDPPDLETAKQLCIELKYWISLEEAAKEKL